MADKKISQLTNITGANLADTDEFVVVDTSATETKAITWAELKEGLDTSTGFVRITGDTMTGDLTVQANIAVTGTVDGRDVAADGTKLDGIEAGATADQTAGEIKTAYESNADTNAYTDAEKTKLAGIEAGATADQTKADIDALGIDAATLDGVDSTGFATAAQGTLADSAVQPGDLATVATTGAYSDLSGTPTLGTAAAADTTDFDPAGTALALAIALG